jgi:hypothetical protein
MYTQKPKKKLKACKVCRSQNIFCEESFDKNFYYCDECGERQGKIKK